MGEIVVGGGGGGRRRNRKKGRGGSGASGSTNGPSSGGNNSATNASSSGSGPTSTTSASGRGGGGGRPRSKRSGGRGRGSGSSGGAEGARYKPNATSPLQLPHVKVTIRNIIDSNKHSSINDILSSVKTFLDGAFPSSKVAGDGTVETDPYMLAWRAEKEEFDNAKSMFAELASSSESANNDNGVPTTPTRPFSSGWVYETTPSSLPSNRLSLLPTSSQIVTNLMSNQTDKKISNTTNVNWVVDTAMSQMMQECGKNYLDYVGGKIVLDEEGIVEVGLAELVAKERKKLSEIEDKKNKAAEETAIAEGESEQPTVTNDEKKDDKVEEVTAGIENLSTSDNNSNNSKPTPPAVKQQPLQREIINNVPAIRIRILSVTPIKQSKRRGELGGKVTLALYPPDPCLLFKDVCRDAGKMAGDLQFEKVKAKEEEEDAAAKKKKEEAVKEEAVVEGENGEVAAASGSKENSNAEEVTKATKPPSPPPKKAAQPPQIPYYPLLSPAERSRAVARSRVLMHRTIEAMKIHAASSAGSQSREVQWEVMESASQKTWKNRPHAMVQSLMEGKELSELVAEDYESAKSGGGGGVKKGRGRGGGGVGFDAKYDSTIEKSEDYKAFMESLKDGSAAPSYKDSKDAKKSDAKATATEEKPVEVDEEGRPLSAIVIHMRAKQAAEDKVKAEARAAADKARAAANAVKEKARKEKQKAKKEARRNKKKEAARAKKRAEKGGRTAGPSSSSSIARPSSKSAAGPPPGAMLLKKGGATIPKSGFG